MSYLLIENTDFTSSNLCWAIAVHMVHLKCLCFRMTGFWSVGIEWTSRTAMGGQCRGPPVVLAWLLLLTSIGYTSKSKASVLLHLLILLPFQLLLPILLSLPYPMSKSRTVWNDICWLIFFMKWVLTLTLLCQWYLSMLIHAYSRLRCHVAYFYLIGQLSLASAFVSSHLDYCNWLLTGITKKFRFIRLFKPIPTH